MKNKIQLTIGLSLLISTSVFAQGEGTHSGNGGLAYVCRDSNQQITEARLLDLWEPEKTLLSSDFTTSVEEQIKKALAKVSDDNEVFKLSQRQLLKYAIAIAKNDRSFVSKSIPLSNDALPAYRPAFGCAFEQVALYGFDYETRDWVLKISKEIYDHPKFSNTDRAALWLHEAMYSLDRQFNSAKDSRNARSAVADLLSDNPTLINGDLIDSILQTYRIDVIYPMTRFEYTRIFLSFAGTLSLGANAKPEITCHLSIRREIENTELTMKFTPTLKHNVKMASIDHFKPSLVQVSYQCFDSIESVRTSLHVVNEKDSTEDLASSASLTTALFRRNDKQQSFKRTILVVPYL